MKGNFKVILMIVFIGMALIGVLVFSGAIPIGSDKDNTGPGGSVVIWGTLKPDTMNGLINIFTTANKNFTIKYEQKSAETFNEDLLEALASGTGPDLFFLPNDIAFRYSNKIFTIPYQSFTLANYKNTFASAGEVFLSSGGILAFPLSIDPLVMYYNRDILDANNIVFPPEYWDDLADISTKMTKKDNDNILIQSAVALGQFVNVNNAKNILATFFLQSGNSIVKEIDERYASVLRSEKGLGNMLSYYTSYSDPLKSVYSWNRSLPNSQEAFISNDLAFYFGFAGELETLIKKNPNQNIGVAQVPQIKNVNSKITDSKVIGIAVSSASKNLNAAISVASLMATGDFAGAFANALKVPPARRDLLASVKPTDAFFPVFYSSALISRSWLDPSPNGSNNIFKNMVDSVLSNNTDASSAIGDAGAKLDLLFIR